MNEAGYVVSHTLTLKAGGWGRRALTFYHLYTFHDVENSQKKATWLLRMWLWSLNVLCHIENHMLPLKGRIICQSWVKAELFSALITEQHHRELQPTLNKKDGKTFPCFCYVYQCVSCVFVHVFVCVCVIYNPNPNPHKVLYQSQKKWMTILETTVITLKHLLYNLL